MKQSTAESLIGIVVLLVVGLVIGGFIWWRIEEGHPAPKPTCPPGYRLEYQDRNPDSDYSAGDLTYSVSCIKNG